MPLLMIIHAQWVNVIPFRYYEVVHPQVEPIVQEVTTVLREWGIIWKKLYLVSVKYFQFLVYCSYIYNKN